jgi:hypothetical protein
MEAGHLRLSFARRPAGSNGLLDESISLSETTKKISSERELDILLSKAIIYSLNRTTSKSRSEIYESLLIGKQ